MHELDPMDRALTPRAGVKPRRARQKFHAPDLPTFYYRDHFEDVLNFVSERYGPCLDESALHFIDGFFALPDMARCAYARLAGRKGHVFNRYHFAYPEITNWDGQIDLLWETGFVRALSQKDYPALLGALTKPELTDLMRRHLLPEGFKKSWAKDALIETALCSIAFDAIDIPEGFIAQGRVETLDYLLFLYFGKIEHNLQNFTLRDLGVRRTPRLGADYGARFDDEKTARAAYFYARALDDFKTGSDAAVMAYIDGAKDWPAPLCPASEIARDKLLRRLGGLSERAGDIDMALSLYEQSCAPLCNERAVRLRYSRNEGQDRAVVKARLEALIDAPASDEEFIFARDFYRRKYDGKRTSLMTDLLREGELISLDEAFKNMPERAALHYYTRAGALGYRAENEPWRALFGLLFWEQLFGAQAQGLYNDFERLPAPLRENTFYDEGALGIERQLDRLDDPARAYLHLLATFTRRYGTLNGVFRWGRDMLDRVKPLLDHAPRGALAAMLRHMARDYKGTKDGFPDLMLIENGALRFIEIKAQGDVISRGQLTRLHQLREAGFCADIVRIDWTIDPQQIYVVVDIETTGGRADISRITEIGAVKMQGGEIIDEWQSLINPGCAVPPFITRLTGITDAMLAPAPSFAEIAPEFARFMEGSIFAAHNVNFDYGFIAAEYERLGQQFQFPKICTVASMRRYYPGHKSYSLKTLCARFEIDLTGHHRAMNDARAAAALLCMVNEKRLADLSA